MDYLEEEGQETPPENEGSPEEPAPAQEGEPAPAPAAEPSADAGLTDEQIWAALADQRAEEYIQLVTASQSQPAPPPANRGQDANADLADLEKRAAEGDEEAAAQYGLRVLEQKRMSTANEANFAEARKRIYESSLGNFEELKDLGVPEKLRLLKAYNAGDAEFMSEAVNIITSKRTTAAPAAADPAKAEAVAERNQEIAAAQGARTPALPAAQNPGGPPPIDPTKSVIDVFDDFFEWEETQAAAKA